jgi:hypothetical protein
VVKTIRTTRKTAALTTCLALAIIPAAAYATSLAKAQGAGVADGKTAILTPEGTLIVPPPGAPLAIAPQVANAAETIHNGTTWGLVDGFSATTASGAYDSFGSCQDLRAGWYETNQGYLWGGHAGITLANLPASGTSICSGDGVGYSDGVNFGNQNWIQAGLVTFPGDSGAKWMCQSNVNGAMTTLYGTANTYGNGATEYAWFSRDSSGVWRTYRYDPGASYSTELGCTISHGDSGGAPLQAFGEIQGATNTSAVMGPWTMLDLRYEDTTGSWYNPSQLQATYAAGTPCPPYGAGTVTSGSFEAGSNEACSTGTTSYP